MINYQLKLKSIPINKKEKLINFIKEINFIKNNKVIINNLNKLDESECEMEYYRNNKYLLNKILVCNFNYEDILRNFFKYYNMIDQKLLSILINNDSNYEFFKAFDNLEIRNNCFALISIAKQNDKYKQRQLRLACE